MFFNKETRRLETYVAGEGKFYDLQGNLVHSLPAVVKPEGQYETVYYLEKNLGRITSRQTRIKDKFVLKEGVTLDEKTGRFVSEITGRELTRDQALEWYSAKNNAYYDTQGNHLRSAPEKAPEEYVTEYRFDKQTGKVKAIKKAIRGRYVIKQGYRLDRKTGRFIQDETGQAVSKDQAVEYIKASEIMKRRNPSETISRQ